MSCGQTVQNNRVLSMLLSTHFHILPCFSGFSVLPTPTYHPLPMLTISHPLHSHQPMIRCLHGGLGDCWFVGFLCWFVSILCFLCLLGGILGTLGLGVSKGAPSGGTAIWVFFWMAYTIPINQTNKLGASSKFWFCLHGIQDSRSN